MASCVSLAVCSSCSDGDMMDVSGQSDKISFGVSISDGWIPAAGARSMDTRQTRYDTFRFGDSSLWIISSEEDSIDSACHRGEPQARAAEAGEGNFYPSFGVYGYVFTGSGTWADNQTSAQLYMSGEVTQMSDVYSTAAKYYWPGTQYSMKFFAYAPYGITDATVGTDGNMPSVTYTVPEEARAQVDLLVADEVETAPAADGNGAEYAGTVAGDYGKSARLHFYHALTAVKVKAVGDGLKGTIKKVELKGVKGVGTHLFGSDSWTLAGDDVDFSQTLDKSVGVDTEGTMVIDGETTFMMIPQTLGGNAALQITFSDGTVLTGSLSGKEWPMGKTVVYRISRTEIVEEPFFTVTPVNTAVSYSGGAYKYEVRSYVRRIVNGAETIEAAPWEITGFQEEGIEDWQEDAPAWLSMENTSGNGVSSVASCETRSAAVTAQSERVANLQNDALKNAEELTGVYDLSTRGNTVAASTANCYIVNAAGTYSLPLVYGNAIKDGQTNEQAYKTDKQGNNILSTFFINHLGREITSPYIYENDDENGDRLSPEKATLIWQDVQNLVTDVQLSSDKKSLTFTVGKSTIRQGNAVVAIRDAQDRVMWSWHIWVTDYNPYAEATSGLHFFTRYVGWCYNDSHIYDPRKVKLHFKQTGTDKTAELEITQTEYIIEDGNNPYYQFGRKDPQLPATTAKSSATDKTWYDAEGKERTNIIVAGSSWSDGNTVIVNGILNPNTFCKDVEMARYFNLWSADNTSDKNTLVSSSIKTVYDPSPTDYKVPAIGLLSNNYTSISKSLYKSGYRHGGTGRLTSVDTEFDVFSCSPGSAAGKVYEIFHSEEANSCDAGHGGAILPVSE